MESDWETWIGEQDDIAFETVDATSDFISFKMDGEDEIYRVTRAGTANEMEFWVMSV